jgi:gas vesicle protein
MRELRGEFGDERGSEAYYRRLEEIREKYETMDPLPENEQEELDALRDELSENSKRVSDTVENEVRQAVGHYEKGNRWTSETILYQLVQSKYGDDYTIKRHHRPDWLDGLELDIFLVEAGVGIEYQGVQHYEAVEHWGGEEALEERQQRDERTKKLCREHGVDVVEVRYDEELSIDVLRAKIDPKLTSEE